MSRLADAQAQVAAAQPLTWVTPPPDPNHAPTDWALPTPDANGVVRTAGLALTILVALGFSGDMWFPPGNQYVRFDPILNRTRVTNASFEMKYAVCCPVDMIDDVIGDVLDAYRYALGYNLPSEQQKRIGLLYLWGDLSRRYPLPGQHSAPFLPLTDAHALYHEQLTGGFDDLAWDPVPPPFGQGGEGRPA